MIETIKTEQDLIEYMMALSFLAMLGFTILSLMALFNIMLPFEAYKITLSGVILTCFTFVYYMIQSNKVNDGEESE